MRILSSLNCVLVTMHSNQGDRKKINDLNEYTKRKTHKFNWNYILSLSSDFAGVICTYIFCGCFAGIVKANTFLNLIQDG